jgi:hypothetical protein
MNGENEPPASQDCTRPYCGSNGVSHVQYNISLCSQHTCEKEMQFVRRQRIWHSRSGGAWPPTVTYARSLEVIDDLDPSYEWNEAYAEASDAQKEPLNDNAATMPRPSPNQRLSRE